MRTLVTRSVAPLLLALAALAAPAEARPGAAACPPADAVRAAEARVRAVMDSLLAASPELHGIAIHLESPERCLSASLAAGAADPAGTPLTPAHPVRMASNTKTYVAAAILRLVEDGRLALDGGIASYLPQPFVDALRADGYDPAAITVAHLLGHTSGLFDYAMSEAYQQAVFRDPHHRWTPLEQVRFGMRHGDAYGEPGAVYHYSDTGYVLLGQILERATGRPLAAALRDLVGYDRLGLAATWLETLEPVPAGVPDRAHQFMGDVDTHGFDPSLDLFGGGGLVATVEDMATFMRALQTGGVFRKGDTWSLMRDTRLVANERSYGLGVGHRAVLGVDGWGHTGFWNTFASHFPALDLTIAASVQQNQDGRAMATLVTAALAAARDLRP